MKMRLRGFENLFQRLYWGTVALTVLSLIFGHAQYAQAVGQSQNIKTVITDKEVDSRVVAGVRIATEFIPAPVPSGTNLDPYPGSAIQAAIDDLPITGGEVFIPAGTWQLSSPLARAIDNIHITGAGTSTKLNLNGSTACISKGTQRGWSIENLNMDVGYLVITEGVFAIPADVVDIGASLQAAHDGMTEDGGVIHIPGLLSGAWRTAVTITKANVFIHGQGKRATGINCINSGTALTVDLTGKVNRTFGIKGMMLRKGNSSPSRAIHLTRVVNGYIRDCLFSRWNNAVQLDDLTVDTDFSDTVFQHEGNEQDIGLDVDTYQVELLASTGTPPHHSWLNNIFIGSVKNGGIHIVNAQDVTLNKPRIENCEKLSICLEGVKAFRLQGGHFENWGVSDTQSESAQTCIEVKASAIGRSKNVGFADCYFATSGNNIYTRARRPVLNPLALA